jgi:chlorophyll(ide) b reductase
VFAAGLPGIGVHNCSPGMVLTDLLLKDSTPFARRFFNALAEEPETVAARLVPQMRELRSRDASIDYLNPIGAIGKVVTGLPQILQGGRFFDKDGNRVRQPGAEYAENGVRVQAGQGDKVLADKSRQEEGTRV